MIAFDSLDDADGHDCYSDWNRTIFGHVTPTEDDHSSDSILVQSKSIHHQPDICYDRVRKRMRQNQVDLFGERNVEPRMNRSL